MTLLESLVLLHWFISSQRLARHGTEQIGVLLQELKLFIAKLEKHLNQVLDLLLQGEEQRRGLHIHEPIVVEPLLHQWLALLLLPSLELVLTEFPIFILYFRDLQTFLFIDVMAGLGLPNVGELIESLL